MKIHSYAVPLLICYGLIPAGASNRHLRGDKQDAALEQQQHGRRDQGMMDGEGNGDGGMHDGEDHDGWDMHDGEDTGDWEDGDHDGDWEGGGDQHHMSGGSGFPFGCGNGGWQGMPMYFANMSNYSGTNDWNWMPMFNETVHNASAWEGIWHMLPNMTNFSIPGMWDQLPPFMTPNNTTMPSWDDMNEFMRNVTGNWSGPDDWDWEDNMSMNHSGWDWSVSNSTGGWNGGMMDHSGWGDSDHMGNASGRCEGMSPDEQWRLMFLLFNMGSMEFDATPVTDGIQATVTSNDSQVVKVLQQAVADMVGSLQRGWDPMSHDAYDPRDEFDIEVKNITKGVRVVVTGTTPCAVDLISDQTEAITKLIQGDLTQLTQPYTTPASCEGSNSTTNDTSAEANLDESAAVGQGTFGRSLLVGVALVASAML